MTPLLQLVSLEEIVADTLNWFENGRLFIGSRQNPNHVQRYEKWLKEIQAEEHERA